jgi:hypothetical protein
MAEADLYENPKRKTLSPKQQCMQRWGALKAERASWWAHWQEITIYVLPRMGRYFVQDRNKGWKRNNSIYDNTATGAARTLAAGLMGGLTSPARPWFRLGTNNKALMTNAAVKEWLSECTSQMLDIFQRSNVYRALASIYLELGAFGTAAAIVAEDFDSVIHIFTLTAGEYAIATNWKGEVCTLYREFQKTVAEIVEEFGYENCSTTAQNLFDNGQLDQWINVLHVVEPRKDRDESKADAQNMAWKSVYYELGGRDDKPLRVSGFRRFKVLAPRWDVAGGDIYGNSPAMEALGDTKQLQQLQLRKSQAIDYKSNPPLQVPTNLKNREVNRLPGGITYRDSAGNGDKIETLFDVNLDISHVLEDIQDVRQRIRSAFYYDLFLMLSQDNPAMTRLTATEVAERHEEKMLMLGPVLERLHNELLKPLIDITFDSMIEAGIVSPPPPELSGEDLNVELISILAQAQRAIATNSVDRFVGNVMQIAQANPEILDNVDFDYYAETYSDMLGVDPQLVRDKDDVAQIRAGRAQQQQAAAQAEQQAQQAKTAQALGATPTQGGTSTALDDALAQYSGYT